MIGPIITTSLVSKKPFSDGAKPASVQKKNYTKRINKHEITKFSLRVKNTI